MSAITVTLPANVLDDLLDAINDAAAVIEEQFEAVTANATLEPIEYTAINLRTAQRLIENAMERA